MKDFAKVEKWMTPEDKVFRQSFDALIETVNKQHLLSTPIEDYEVFESGTSSVVALIKDHENKTLIFKTSIDGDDIISESIALKHWRQVVSTPEIYFVHSANDDLPVTFFIAEHITASTSNRETAKRLKETPQEQRIDRRLSKQMGEKLASIHTLKPPKGESIFPHKDKQSINKVALQSFEYLEDLNLVNEKHQALLNLALQIINKSSEQYGTLCHGDFLPYNLLLTEDQELIIFDPDTVITHALYDLANTLVTTMVEAPEFGAKESLEILKGYESITPIDYDLLSAFFSIHCIRKAAKWNSKDRHRKVEPALQLLETPPAFLRKNK